ncbi:nitric oxide reductase activation protein NorD [Amycolatopsis methanolica]|uniref:von Willebrand factor, type A n=1 Tax=Amycolatopsis methanolica 239 TaxID=1068978 RepID=A0A076MQT6_AMYME|nr:VWA domain-containing protein [Amycolatopsis methanolica]AIJ21311.1 von Willebrand factor, type A [Amycolatopsis methanolica 239]
MTKTGALAEYSLLASAVGCRDVEVVGVDGGPSYTDGRHVVVDARASDPLPTLLCQSALIGAGSLQPDMVRKLSRGRETVARYVLLEVHRACRSLRNSLPGWFVELVGSSPGAEVSASAEESLQRALGREELPATPEWFGTVMPRTSLRKGKASRSTPVDGSKLKAAEVVAPDRDAQDDPVRRIFRAPFAVHNPLSRLLGRGLSRAERHPRGSVSALHLDDSNLAAGSGRRLVTSPPGSGRSSFAAVPEPLAGSRFPEWDCWRGEYRRGWCSVIEYAPEQRVPRPAPEVSVHGDRAIRADLARVSRSLAWHTRQPQGEDVDLDAVVQGVARSGRASPHIEHAYREKRRSRPDLTVSILLDASGSTADEQPSGGTVYDRQSAIVLNLMRALEDVGHGVEVTAFNSAGRAQVRVIPIKRLQENGNSAVRSRLFQVRPTGCTRMGAAIRYATRRMAHVPAGRQVLLMVSDGFPYDQNYEGRYADADTGRALREARRAGVACVCLSVSNTMTEDRLTQIFGNAAHLRLASDRDVSERVVSLLRQALRGVSQTV